MGALLQLERKRWYWNAYRMIFNLVEGAIIIGLLYPTICEDDHCYRLLYAMDFLAGSTAISLLGDVLIEFIQMFHNVFLYMSSTLYITDGIFNAQSLISAETDGVEEMMMVLGSGMTCLHIVRVFYVSTNNLNAGFWQSQHGMHVAGTLNATIKDPNQLVTVRIRSNVAVSTKQEVLWMNRGR